MTIEPHEVTTVSIRAMPSRPPEQRTLQDYQDDLKRRFGCVPSWKELAKRENAEMRARRGIIHKGHLVGGQVYPAKVAKARAEWIVALSRLPQPFFTRDAAEAWGMRTDSAPSRLNSLLTAGLIRKVSGGSGRPAVWEIVRS